jgi:hypothetical protein
MWCEVGLPPEEDAHAWLATMREWDDPMYHAALHAGYESIRHDRKDYRGWFLWPRGTRVVYETLGSGPGARSVVATKRAVWILTGLYFPLTQSTVYEGKWPD